MKLQFIKTPLILTFIFSVAFTGCLKDTYYDNGQTQSFMGSTTQVISLGINVQTPDNTTSLAFDNSLSDTTVQLVPVELGGPNNATQDIHVTIGLADNWVDSLNASNDATGAGPSDYIVPSSVTIVNPVVTIPKGSRVGYLEATFKPADLIGVDAAMGFQVESVQETGYTISSNLGHGVVVLVIKNKYDGKYILTMKSVGWGAYGIADDQTFTWPGTVIFASTGGASNIFSTPQLGNLQPAFTSTGSITGFGATTPQLSFDPVTNLLTQVINLSPPDSRNRTLTINAAVPDSRYDPATKTIYAAYIMNQNGRPPQYFYDTLVYQGPR